ncbi:MAG: TlpA family protein disulfide reductase [Bacteroidota bacterium]|nr:TlpA family protein disulfide reductase [Bacteroidota bacterium]
MKFLATLVSFLLLSGLVNAQTWLWSSDVLQPGQDVKISVNDIDIQEGTHIVSYYMDGRNLMKSDINYFAENSTLKLILKVPENTNWLRIVIKDEYGEPISADARDINNPNAPVAASAIDCANASAYYSSVIGLDRDEVALTKMYKDAVAANPKWLDDPNVVMMYYNMAKASKGEEDLKNINSHITTYTKSPDNLSQEMLMSAIRIAKMNGDSVSVKAFRKALDSKYPQSLMAQEDQVAFFRNASSMADKIILRDKFKATYPVTDFNRNFYDQMTRTLVDECMNKSEWEKAEAYIQEIIDPSTKSSVCNSYAWTLVGEDLNQPSRNIELAERLSLSSIEALTPDLKAPPTFSDYEWKKQVADNRAGYGDTYALVLYKQGKYKEAVSLQAVAVKNAHFEDFEMNDRYATYLSKAGQNGEAISFLEKMISDSKATGSMKNLHEELWTAANPNDSYDTHFNELEAIAQAKQYDAIKKQWLDEPSVPFKLKNLDGKEVTLADYKGKVVVLDFWATWCGPCKASFPGMKNAVEHYSTDKDVAFLFVDTWEQGNDVPGKVGKFIGENKYPFHVLLDDGMVVAQYKVSGIPTKFIIDGNQKIRFRAVGYSGNNDLLVEELVTMIEMAKKGI